MTAMAAVHASSTVVSETHHTSNKQIERPGLNGEKIGHANVWRIF